MAQDTSIDDPVRAFDALRREVSLALRATQGLSAEHREQPDYTETLKAMDARLGAISANLKIIAERPAMQLTPASLADSILAASVQVRASDAALIRAAHDTSTTLIQQLRLALQQVASAKLQQQRLILAVAGGALLGILLWSILPGMVVRVLPSSWAAPEWMAARVMRMDRHDAGIRLLGLENIVSVPALPAFAASAALKPKPHLRRRR